MCLSNSKPITRIGYKVFNKVNSNKFTTIKKRAVKGEMKVGQFYHVKENSKAYYKSKEHGCPYGVEKFASTKELKSEHGFHVFDNFEDANKLKEFIQELKSQFGDDDNILADGKMIVKKVLCQKVFTEGFQPTNQEELFATEECLKDREPNAFRCKKIKILDEGITMKEKIKKILRKHAKNQTNLHSETAREVIATEIIEALGQDRGLDFDVEDTYKAQGEALKSRLEDK